MAPWPRRAPVPRPAQATARCITRSQSPTTQTACSLCGTSRKWPRPPMPQPGPNANAVASRHAARCPAASRQLQPWPGTVSPLSPSTLASPLTVLVRQGRLASDRRRAVRARRSSPTSWACAPHENLRPAGASRPQLQLQPCNRSWVLLPSGSARLLGGALVALAVAWIMVPSAAGPCYEPSSINMHQWETGPCS